MTHITALPDGNGDGTFEPEHRPAKRVKIDSAVPENGEVEDTSALVWRHPLGVRPLGNAFTSSVDLKTRCGLFAVLPDELIMQFLEMLQLPHLLRLGSTCKAMHAFTRSEELWRTLFIESSPNSFTWKGTWRATYLQVNREPQINCSGLFSDVLHRPFYCAHVSLAQYVSNIPKQNAIPRLPDVFSEAFASDWFDKPFILTSPIKEWPIYRSWTTEYLVEKYADVRFRAEAVDWRLKAYIDYMNNNHDESPLYLFDRAFAEKMNLTTSAEDGDYWPPTCFGVDYFSVLGDHRPDHRWLIVGPERSGSTFHTDPNATSAWNAVIKGSKYWIMFPSSPSLPPPPGVYISKDKSEVTSPLSIAEWLLGFHAEARAMPGCKEGICYEGEVLHVPSGWYHLVLNLEPSIAITQNFVPRARLGAVLQFLRDQKKSISGFSEEVEDPLSLFLGKLRMFDPIVFGGALNDLAKLDQGSKGKWEKLREADKDGEGAFGFGFGSDEDDEDGEEVIPVDLDSDQYEPEDIGDYISDFDGDEDDE